MLRNTYSVCNLAKFGIKTKGCSIHAVIYFFRNIYFRMYRLIPQVQTKNLLIYFDDFDGDLYSENDGDLMIMIQQFIQEQKNFVMKRTTIKMVKSTKVRKITTSTIQISTKMVLVTIQPDTQHVFQKTH